MPVKLSNTKTWKWKVLFLQEADKGHACIYLGFSGLAVPCEYSQGYLPGFGPFMECINPKLYQGDIVLWRKMKPTEIRTLRLPLCITVGSGKG